MAADSSASVNAPQTAVNPLRPTNSNQKTSYIKPIWYNWMFYYYLATIHAVVRLIKEAGA